MAESMGTLEAHHPSDLALYHRNPKQGDVTAIAASLRVNRQYRPIVVNRGTHTNRPMEVLAGNHTLKAFRDLAERYPSDDTWQAIDCYVVDVDDDRAARIVAADNRTAELGSIDDETLLELLSELDDLEGTGYDADDLEMLKELAEGPPSLDDLADQVGDPKDDDAHTVVRLKLEPDVADEWARHRKNFDDDTAAVRAALNI